jgi:hypothetical protein
MQVHWCSGALGVASVALLMPPSCPPSIQALLPLPHQQLCHTPLYESKRTLSMFGGMALPPTPILLQSMKSPSSLKVNRPTTTPFSEATTLKRLYRGDKLRNGGGKGASH